MPTFSYNPLRKAAAGTVYLVLASGVYRVNLETCEVTLVWKMPVEEIEITGPLAG